MTTVPIPFHCTQWARLCSMQIIDCTVVLFLDVGCAMPNCACTGALAMRLVISWPKVGRMRGASIAQWARITSHPSMISPLTLD